MSSPRTVAEGLKPGRGGSGKICVCFSSWCGKGDLVGSLARAATVSVEAQKYHGLWCQPIGRHSGNAMMAWSDVSDGTRMASSKEADAETGTL
jgi:hypothetical protein